MPNEDEAVLTAFLAWWAEIDDEAAVPLWEEVEHALAAYEAAQNPYDLDDVLLAEALYSR